MDGCLRAHADVRMDVDRVVLEKSNMHSMAAEEKEACTPCTAERYQ